MQKKLERKNRFTLLALLLLTIHFSGNAQNSSYVIIKPNSHTALITGIAKVPNQNLVLTCSFDKTIKIWNTTTAAYEDEILGEIGPEGLGGYSKITVSQDGKKIATAGIAFPISDVNVGAHYGIRIFDIESRKLEKLLPLSLDNVAGINFIDNGKKLAVCSSNQIYIVDCKTWQTIDTVSAPENELISKTLLFRDKLYFITQEGTLFYYDVISKKNVVVYYYKTTVWAIACNDVSGFIAIATAQGDVKLIDEKYQPIFTQHSNDYPISLAFSPLGNNLVVGYYITTDGCKLFSIENRKLKFVSNLKDQTGLVGAITFYDNNKVVTAGGDRNSVDFWEVSVTDSAKLIRSLKSNTLPIMAACEYGGSLAFSTELTFNENTFPYRWMFDLESHKSMPIVPFGTLLYMLPKPITAQGSYELVPKDNGGKTLISIVKNGNPFNSLGVIDATSYTFLPNGTIAIGGNKGNLRVYDIFGMEVADLVGHNDMVTSLTLNSGGNYLISSSKDGTIKFWAIKNLVYNDEGNSTPVQEITDPLFIEKVKEWGLEKEAQDKSSENWIKVITACFVNGKNEWGDKLYQQLSFFKQFYLNHINADMNIFISNDNEWVFWDKDNYYSGSKAGCRMIGFHINQGIAKEGKFYPFEQFDLTNNRPDIIFKFFNPYDTATAKAYYNAYLKRLKNLKIDPSKINNNGKLPQLKIMNVSGTSNQSQFQLNFSAIDSFSILSKIMVFVNDVPVYGSGGKSIEATNKKDFNTEVQKGIIPTLHLSEGKNKIQVSVINQNGVESLRETFVIQYNSSIAKKPNLYVISIGVSIYKNSAYNLTYAGKDAGDIAKELSTQKERFDTITAINLINENVTKENILKLKQTLVKSNVDDHVVVFLAGHGLLDKDFNFYFATHDIDFNDPGTKGISFSEIENLMDGIASRNKLLLVDACHSGEVDNSEDLDISSLQKPTYEPLPSGTKVTKYLNRGTKIAEKKTDEPEKVGLKNSISLLSEMFYDLRRSSGTVVISAASAEGFALESSRWHNGVFTYAVINGLKDHQADIDKNNLINISELKEYVIKEVDMLTEGKQQPTMRRENSENDFRVW